MKKQHVLQVVLFATCIGSLPVLGDDTDSPVRFIEDFQLIKDHAESELSEIYEKAEKEYDPHKSRSEQKELFAEINARSTSIQEAATRKAFAVIKPHSAKDAAAEPLAWIAKNSKISEEGRAAIALLLKHHLVHKKTLELSKSLGPTSPLAEQILRAQLNSRELPNEDKWKVKLSLARLLLVKTNLIERCSAATGDELAQLVNRLGNERIAVIRQASFETLEAEAISLFKDLQQQQGEQEVTPGLSLSDFSDSCIFAMKSLRIGMTAPNIEGEDLGGEVLRLSDYRGRVVLLSFWATWCGPCLAEIPHEVSLVEKYKERPFSIVGVNADPKRQDVKPVLIKHKISWRSFWCGDAGHLGPIPKAWNVSGWPTTFLIDASGTIRGKNLSGATLDKTIAELVAEAEKK